MFETLVLCTREEKAILRDPELEEEFFYFDLEMLNHRSYVVVMEQKKIVGMVAIVDQSMWFEKAVGVGFVETHSECRDRGIGRLLVDGLFQYARKHGKAIANTAYTPDGLKWLHPLMKEAAERYPDVVLHERQF